MPVTTVFFDLGDTLWHFPNMPPLDDVRRTTMRQIGGLVQGKWGYDMDEEDRRFIGRNIRLAIQEETHQAFHGDCVDPGYPEICRRIAKEHGMDLTAEQGEELWEAWNLSGQFLNRALFPDVLPTMHELQKRGYRLACITNRGYSGPKFYEELDALGLTPFFEAMVVSCDVGYLKPHPRIYQTALEAMNIEPEEAVMVGDNMRADVEGAKTLGLTAVWRRPHTGEPHEAATDEPELSGPIAPDYTINEIGELSDLPILESAPSRSS
jgi:HAD superfamily hydrolase (TIGR01662 family)